MNSRRNNRLSAFASLFGMMLIGGLLSALALAPVALAGGWLVNSSVETMNSNLQDLSSNKDLPLTTTITDRDGNPLAYLYKQRRFDIASQDISQEMKKSIVAIEDRRFYEHNGVDIRGTARAALANLTSGEVTEGASTINQQYVKNYLLLVQATSDSERSAATETSIPRKLREMRMAANLDKQYSKDEILTRYLNLVPFGEGAFGVEAAAQTFFGIHASELDTAQSALLAGVVQSTSALDPYNNPKGATDRRNTVLQARVTNGTLTQEQADAAKQKPLGILPEPHTEINGCIGAGDAGFFCDYVLQFLEEKGMPLEELTQGGYTIRTTLDPHAQEAAHSAVTKNISPTQKGVSGTANFISPAANTHEVVAMASSRTYGLDADKSQTVNPVTHALEGHGAGSIFKIFPSALAIEDGMGLDTMLDVPNRIEVDGIGFGGAEGCPPTKYCVENAGPYKPRMTLREALATSPNTPFVAMIKNIGVDKTVDMAVKLGLRSYADKGSYDANTSIADNVKETKQGSFVLGPTPVNPLELSNVAATLADNGRWCEPTPVLSISNPDGSPHPITTTPCEQVLEPDIAHALSNALGSDATSGTAAAAASSSGWKGPISAKTGTTETNNSAAFLGFTPKWAGSTYIFNDGGTAASLCTSPVRQCAQGNLFGGNEPAQTFFAATNPVISNYGGAGLPAYDPKYNRGTNPPAGSDSSPGGFFGRDPGRPRIETPLPPELEQFRRGAEEFLNRLDSALRGQNRR